MAFAHYAKPFLLKMDASKDKWYHLVTYGSRTLTPHEKYYHLTKLGFLVLKWAVAEHFKEYLLYQPFLVKTDNNPLTYIMMTPNLDATGHQWVGALAWFNFELEYQKGCDNTVADMLSQVTTQLDPDIVKSILDKVALGAAHQAETHNPDHGREWLLLRARGTCCHRLLASADACNGLGWRPKRGPSTTECSFRLAGVTEEDRFKSTSGKPCLQWGRQTDPIESSEFYDLYGSPILALDIQRWDWRFATVCSP